MEPSGAGPVGRGGARERTEFSPPGGNRGKRTLRRRCPPYWKYPPGALLLPRLSAPAAHSVTPPVQERQVRRRNSGTLGPTAKHFRRIRPYRLPFRGVTHPRRVWSKTRRQRDRTTAFPCSSHGWPWPGGVQFPGTQMEPSGAGPFGRGGARERTEFSPSGGNRGERTL